MTPLIKVGIVAGTFTTLASAGYIGGICSAPNLKISNLIEEEYTHLLLSTTDNKDADHWANNWNNYKKKKENVLGLWGWRDNDDSLNLTKELKEKCSYVKNYFVYSKNDDLYKNVTNYCARYVTVEDEAKKGGWKILDTEGDESKNTWAKREQFKSALQNDINKLEINYQTAKADTIKEGCKKAKTKGKNLEDYLNIYEAYKTVCTNAT